jgi:predicted amidohydrolase YtcJ
MTKTDPTRSSSINNPAAQPPADLILLDGKLWTQNPDRPWAQALAATGSRITAVGSDAEIESRIGPQTRVVDLAGRLALPGFNDAHTHHMWDAVFPVLREDEWVDCYGLRDYPAAQERLRAYAAAHPGNGWVLGWRWDPSRFPQDTPPTRQMLDAVDPRRPLAVIDVDIKTCWVNTPALQALGCWEPGPDPVDGKVYRDDAGRPTGLLLQTAFDGVPHGQSLSPAAFARAFQARVRQLHSLGVTSISSCGALPEHLAACAKLSRDGKLGLRIRHWPFLEDGLESAEGMRELFRGDPYNAVGGLKLFMDGALGARTAWMLDPYSDAPGEFGAARLDVELTRQRVVAADAAGFQVIAHAIGDRAVRTALDMFADARAANGPRDSRHRIEHAEIIAPDDQIRFAELGVIASMTPLHCTAWIDDYLKARLGEARAANGYLWRRLMDLGVHVCFGSDWPCIDLPAPDPLEEIFGAVTRTTRRAWGEPVWYPEQRLRVDQAVRCHTLEGAFAEFAENEKGRLRAGMLADVCVLSKNVFTCAPLDILDTHCDLTVFDGRLVFER